ncbi:hypothetical protein FHL15_009357 [Xylaria flabelliformis]|uniref:Rhodopsin domain-containing protein n=1 Tax=Xylaria flabelliformis TaxID=2512241 RepID=A0A553HP92_9PEZI|nr:hypothetical protein FHL15_009357 [Xylaria flabelliformis]
MFYAPGSLPYSCTTSKAVIHEIPTSLPSHWKPSMATDVISASARADAPISSAEFIGVATLYVTICTIFTVARLYTRFFIHQQLWWDDWAMLLAWLGTIALCTLQLIMLQHGAGLNIWEVPENELKEFLKARTVKSVFWWIIQAVIWLNVLYSVSLILVLTLQCVPYHLPWGSSCINQYLVLVLASVINIISDIAVLVIPIAFIIRLRTTKRRKWAIWALFAFGTLAPLASIARLGYQIPLAKGANKTVIYPIVLFLASAEQTVAMIVGSAPIASGVVIGMYRQKRPRNRGLQKKTLTERIWPGREARSEYSQGGIPDPFPISDPTPMVTESAEGLNPNMKGKESDGEHEDPWGIVSREISNVKKTGHEDSGKSYV